MKSKHGGIIQTTMLAVLALLLGACARYPQDPRHSLEDALARGTLRIGVLNHAPWVTGQPPQPPDGLEAALLTAFADELGVEPEWRWGSGEELFLALERYELDVVIGGISKDNAWSRHVAFTLPYYRNEIIVAVPASLVAPTSLEGVTVAARPERGLSQLLQERDADVVLLEELAAFDGPVAAEAWEVAGLGLQPTGIRLQEVKQVMAVPPGENALLMRLEDFLLRQKDEVEIAARLWEAARP